MKTYSLESQYSKARERGRERNGRDPRGNLLVRPFVPESTPNQHSPTCDPLLSTVSGTPHVLQYDAPFHLLFWGPMCSIPHTAGLFGPEEQAKFLSPVISHGRAICIIDIMLKKHYSIRLQHSLVMS